MRHAVDGYEIDDDRRRIDIDAVHAFIAGESYWGRGRPLDLVERAWSGSARVLGCYHGGAQVGGCRVISDAATYAYLADVYVVAAHRRRGLGVAIVRAAVEGDGYRELRWQLHTSDAHRLYARFGFEPDAGDARAMFRAAGSLSRP